MKILDNITKNINKVCLYIGVVLLFVVVAAAFTQVLCRYALNIAMPWTEELARMAFNWMSMIGVGLCVAEVSDPVMSMLPDGLKKRGLFLGDKILQVIIYIIMLFMAIMIFYYGTLTLANVGIQSSPQLGVGLQYLYASIPLGMIMIVLNIVNNACKLLLVKEEKKEIEEVQA